jgi:hypothetical protein
MLRQTFTSEPFTYRLPGDIPVTFFPFTHYNDYLITPPRIYGEAYDGFGVTGMFLQEETLVDGYEVVYLWLSNDQVHYPGNIYRLYRWNATTGAYLGGLDTGSTPSDGPYVQMLAQSRDSTIWSLRTDVQHIRKVTVDPDTGITFGDTVYDISGWSSLSGTISAFSVDAEQNLLLAALAVEDHFGVYDLTSGDLIRTIYVPGYVSQIMPEDTNRCYVAHARGDEHRIGLVNYSAGELLSVFKIDDTFDPLTSQKVITWDRKYRRFLVWNDAPVTTEGQNTSVVKGYFPQPQPVGFTKPIPLRPPRKYRSTPILTRLYGDMGEPMPGARVTFSPDSGIGTVTGFPALTDADGESIGTVYGADAGSLTLTASTDV